MTEVKMYVCIQCGEPCTFKGSIHPSSIEHFNCGVLAMWEEVNEEEYNRAFQSNIKNGIDSANYINKEF